MLGSSDRVKSEYHEEIVSRSDGGDSESSLDCTARYKAHSRLRFYRRTSSVINTIKDISKNGAPTLSTGKWHKYPGKDGSVVINRSALKAD